MYPKRSEPTYALLPDWEITVRIFVFSAGAFFPAVGSEHAVVWETGGYVPHPISLIRFALDLQSEDHAGLVMQEPNRRRQKQWFRRMLKFLISVQNKNN